MKQRKKNRRLRANASQLYLDFRIAWHFGNELKSILRLLGYLRCGALMQKFQFRKALVSEVALQRSAERNFLLTIRRLVLLSAQVCWVDNKQLHWKSRQSDATCNRWFDHSKGNRHNENWQGQANFCSLFVQLSITWLQNIFQRVNLMTHFANGGFKTKM